MVVIVSKNYRSLPLSDVIERLSVWNGPKNIQYIFIQGTVPSQSSVSKKDKIYSYTLSALPIVSVLSKVFVIRDPLLFSFPFSSIAKTSLNSTGNPKLYLKTFDTVWHSTLLIRRPQVAQVGQNIQLRWLKKIIPV